MARYQQSTYTEVCRWFDNTEIEYLKGGRKIGKKSQDRFDEYSKAKTVAEALALGAKTMDIVHDYEMKLLKRSGGPCREVAVKLSDIQDPSKLSKMEHLFAKWAQAYLYGGDAGDRIVEKSERDEAHRKKKEMLANRKANPGNSEDSAKAALAKLKAMGAKKGSMLTKIMAMRAGGVSAAATAAASKDTTPASGATSVKLTPETSTADGVASDAAVAKPLFNKIAQPENDTEKKKAPATLASRGLLARVLAKRSGGSVTEAPAKPSPLSDNPLLPKVKPQEQSEQPTVQKRTVKPKKLMASGGLLARVQNAKQSKTRSDSPDAISTPPPAKRARRDADDEFEASAKKTEPPSAQQSAVADAGMKTDQPASVVKPDGHDEQIAEIQPTSSAEPSPSPVSDPTCLDFIRIAEMLAVSSDLEQTSRLLGEHLRSISRNACAPEAALKSALAFLDPSATVSDSITASALDKAYQLPSALSLHGEMLAAKALEGRSLQQPQAVDSPPLSIQDVVGTARDANSESEEERNNAAERMSGLFSRTKTGMEAFYLVRAFQGKLAPNRDTLQGAVVVALM